MNQAGPRRIPGQTYTYYGALLSRRQPPDVAPNVVRWNQGGWHDVDHDPEKTTGTSRVLVLGDSYVEGIQVRLDELYHRQLERRLGGGRGAVEVIAMASSGWGQARALEVLRTQGLSYRPDLVIVEFLPGNDVRNNQPELQRLAQLEARGSSFARALFIRSLDHGLLLPALVFERIDLAIRQARGKQHPIDGEVYWGFPHDRQETWTEAWARTADLLKEIKAVSAGAGAELLVVIFTSRMEIEAAVPGASPGPDGWDMSLPARRVLAICEQSGLSCLDLAPRFARLPQAERQRLHLAGDGHWSRHGHRHAAEETSRYLVEETSTWRRVLARSVPTEPGAAR